MTEPKKLRPRRPRAALEAQPTPAAVVDEVVDTPPAPPALPALSELAPKPYRTGRWSGFPNYECARCEFRTLDRALIEDHVRTAHKR